jgi:hypothetical protein
MLSHIANILKGFWSMFVRAVWRNERRDFWPRRFRPLDTPTVRDADLPGLCRPDFSKMTSALFDRR